MAQQIINKISERSSWRKMISDKQNNPSSNLKDPNAREGYSGMVPYNRDMSLSGLRNTVGQAQHFVDEALSSDTISTLSTSNINKLWRAKILVERNPLMNGGKPLDTYTTRNAQASLADANNKHVAKEESLSLAESSDDFQVARRTYMRTSSDIRKTQNKIRSQQDLSLKPKNDIIIVNEGNPYTAIVIQNRPNVLQVNPGSNWASVKSMGRNNPFMMYTGGEDTIVLDISWYCSDKDNRQEVVNKCRLLESWTRADGYSYAPPVLRIIWGNSGMFDNDYFILESAPYQLTHFQNASKRTLEDYIESAYSEGGLSVARNGAASIRDLKLLPNYATQTLTFKRVTDNNRTHSQIISVEELQKTKGITLVSSESTPDSININY